MKAQTTIMTTNKGRRIKWFGETSNSGKSLRCYQRGGAVVFVDRITGRSVLGQNGRSKVMGPKPITATWGDNEFADTAIDALIARLG